MASAASLAYRLIRFNVIQSIQGEAIPQEFLYLLPAHLLVDMTPYDTFFLSMSQVGTTDYVMRNDTQNRIEALPLPVFGDYQDSPELGNVIAFTDGVFNEGLWQNESWIYGYQFGRGYLDHPEQGSLVVFRGCTEEDTLQAIKEQIHSYSHKIPPVVSLNFTSEEAVAAINFVKPFENGVFAQELNRYYNPPTMVYRRYINGCQTDETITINLETEEVTYSEVRYSEEDMATMPDIALLVSELAAQYKESTPTPPRHIPTEEQNLFDLRVYGWYAKVGDTVYGIIRTSWIYSELAALEGYMYPYWMYYYDDVYLLLAPAQDSPRMIDREELIELVGSRRNIYTGEYGTAKEMLDDIWWLFSRGY